jgi:uncharacterized protein YllA (UPF0747 family)
VATFVAGPTEVAYCGEIRGVFEALGVPMPRLLPRASITLMTARQERALSKFGLAARDFLALDRENPPARDAAAGGRPGSLPPDLEGPVSRIEGSVTAELGKLRRELARMDPAASRTFDKLGRQIEERVGRLRARLQEARDRSAGRGKERWQRLGSELLPRGRLQERVYGPLPYLARHGPLLPQEIARRIDAFDFRHRILEPGPPAKEA